MHFNQTLVKAIQGNLSIIGGMDSRLRGNDGSKYALLMINHELTSIAGQKEPGRPPLTA